MRARCAALTNMRWLHMDARDLAELAAGTFDFAIDVGTFDAIVCGSDESGRRALREMLRVRARVRCGVVWRAESLEGCKRRGETVGQSGCAIRRKVRERKRQGHETPPTRFRMAGIKQGEAGQEGRSGECGYPFCVSVKSHQAVKSLKRQARPSHGHGS